MPDAAPYQPGHHGMEDVGDEEADDAHLQGEGVTAPQAPQHRYHQHGEEDVGDGPHPDVLPHDLQGGGLRAVHHGWQRRVVVARSFGHGPTNRVAAASRTAVASRPAPKNSVSVGQISKRSRAPSREPATALSVPELPT